MFIDKGIIGFILGIIFTIVLLSIIAYNNSKK